MTAEEIDRLLDEFRAWLTDASLLLPEEFAKGEDQAALAEHAAALPEPLDLHTLLAQFVALRHEVNLQTKICRAQIDQQTEALKSLEQGRAQLEKQQQAAAERALELQDARLRPLLKTLIELHDALALARRELERLRATIEPDLNLLRQALPEEDGLSPLSDLKLPRLSWFSLLFGSAEPSRRTVALQERVARQQERIQVLAHVVTQQLQAAERVRQLLDSAITGYAMSLERVERTFDLHGLEPIISVGAPFDPDTMEVIEVVNDRGRMATEVIDEIRRGYRWRGKLFRCALVRVAKP